MRIARKLLLLALTVGAFMALGASSASAVEVIDEANGNPCPEVVETHTGGVSGGCPLEGVSTDLELGGAFGLMIACDVLLEGGVNHAGEAVGEYTTICDETGSAVPCTSEGSQHVTAEITSDAGFPYGQESHFCTVVAGIQLQCHVNGSLVEAAAHDYALTYNHTTKCENNGSSSLQGVINLLENAAHPAIEIVE